MATEPTHGYLPILFGFSLESMGPPVPGKPILLISGALVSHGGPGLWAVSTTALAAVPLGEHFWHLAGAAMADARPAARQKERDRSKRRRSQGPYLYPGRCEMRIAIDRPHESYDHLDALRELYRAAYRRKQRRKFWNEVSAFAIFAAGALAALRVLKIWP